MITMFELKDELLSIYIHLIEDLEDVGLANEKFQEYITLNIRDRYPGYRIHLFNQTIKRAKELQYFAY